MSIRALHCALPLLAVLVAGGCSKKDTDTKVDEVRANAVVGTVSYRERVPMPDNAEVYVWIVDDSPGVVTQAIIAENTIPTEGRQVPIPFELGYDPSRIATDHTYALKAVIKAHDITLWASDDTYRVITNGSPRRVDMWLRQE